MIKKSRVCLISDLHLGVHSNSILWHEIALKWAEWLSKDLKRNNIKDIVFCGDWHHNRDEISVNTLHVSAQILDILEEFNIIMITGNHDMYYKHRNDVHSLSIFKNRKNIQIVDKPTPVEWFDKKITLCPWGTSLKDVLESDILIGHFEIESFKMNQIKVCEDGYKIKDMLTLAPLVISGHFHIRHEKTYGSGTIMYVGNPFQMDFGDVDNDKGYYILDLDSLSRTFVNNNISPQYKKIKLSELIQHQTITSEVRGIFLGNIVKLIIDRDISQENLNILTTKLNQLKSINLIIDFDVNYNTIQCSQINEKDLSGVDIPTAIEEFINLLDITNKKEVLATTLSLYNNSIE